MAVLIFFFIVLEKSICEGVCLYIQKARLFSGRASLDLRLFMAISEVFTGFGIIGRDHFR